MNPSNSTSSQQYSWKIAFMHSDNNITMLISKRMRRREKDTEWMRRREKNIERIEERKRHKHLCLPSSSLAIKIEDEIFLPIFVVLISYSYDHTKFYNKRTLYRYTYLYFLDSFYLILKTLGLNSTLLIGIFLYTVNCVISYVE